MYKRKRMGTAVGVCICAALMFGTATAFAAGQAETGAMSGGPGEIKTHDEKKMQDQFQNTDQLLLVKGTVGCEADISYYVHMQNGWQHMWTEPGYVGSKGITEDKKEGDKATPAGVYSFDLAFGLLEDPGSVLPYHQIVQGDIWVDDPASAYYNRLVNTSSVSKDWVSGENLIQASPYYNYALNLTYNADCVPGEGSAIFLHCFMDSSYKGSSGCICLPQERMEELIKNVTSDTKIVIVGSDG